MEFSEDKFFKDNKSINKNYFYENLKKISEDVNFLRSQTKNAEKIIDALNNNIANNIDKYDDDTNLELFKYICDYYSNIIIIFSKITNLNLKYSDINYELYDQIQKLDDNDKIQIIKQIAEKNLNNTLESICGKKI